MLLIVNHFPPYITNSTQSTCHLASFPGSAGRAWERGYMSSTACYKMVPLCQGVGSWEQSPYAHFKTLQQTLARTSDAHSCDSHTGWTMLHSNISSIMSKLNTLLSSTLNQNVVFVHLQRVLELKGILWTSYTQVL